MIALCSIQKNPQERPYSKGDLFAIPGVMDN